MREFGAFRVRDSVCICFVGVVIDLGLGLGLRLARMASDGVCWCGRAQ